MYVYNAIKEDLKFWEGKDYQNFKGKELEHAEQWRIIAALIKGKQPYKSPNGGPRRKPHGRRNGTGQKHAV